MLVDVNVGGCDFGDHAGVVDAVLVRGAGVSAPFVAVPVDPDEVPGDCLPDVAQECRVVQVEEVGVIECPAPAVARVGTVVVPVLIVRGVGPVECLG